MGSLRCLVTSILFVHALLFLIVAQDRGNLKLRNMKYLTLFVAIIAIVFACKKKEEPAPEPVKPTTPTTTTTGSTPVLTDKEKIQDKNWKLYRTETISGSAWFGSVDSNDIYRFQWTGQLQLTIDQGTTKLYATDPTTLTGAWTISGDLMTYNHNGFAGSEKQYNITFSTNDTFCIKRADSQSFAYFSKLP